MKTKLVSVILIALASVLVQGCGSSTPVAGTSTTTNTTALLKGSTHQSGTALTYLRESKSKFLRGLGELIESSAWASYASTYIHAGGTSAYQLTFHKIYLSTAADCGVLGTGVAPVLVKDFGTAGTTFDLVSAPTIADLSAVAAGSYQCVIFQVGTNWITTPNAASQAAFAGCANGQAHSFDLCVQAGPSYLTGKDLNGATSACTVGAGTAIWTLFFPVSAAKVTALNNAGYVSYAPLTSAITIPPATPLIFYADTSVIAGANAGYGDNATGVTDWAYWETPAKNDSAVCYVDGPQLGFRNQ